jgi:hypothetical protein
MKTLWVLGEEQISSDIPNLIHWVCNSNVEFDQIKYDLTTIDGKIFFKISGIRSSQYSEFYYGLVSRSGNGFVDFLVYERSEPPTENSIPIAVAEATKCNGKESGNMNSQRASKKIAIIEKWGNIPFAYLIANSLPIEETQKSFGHSHNCDFATMSYFGADILISKIGELGYQKYENPIEFSSVVDVCAQEGLKKSKSGFIPSRVFCGDNVIQIQANLFKNKGNNDPGEGYIASRAYLCRLLSTDEEIQIINHNRPREYFERKNNKLVNVLKIVGVTIVFPDGNNLVIEKQPGIYDKDYWQYSNRGEKIASIVMENYYVNLGWEVLFTNHAGCGKSYVSANGEYYKTKKSKGLPDLVLYNKSQNLLYVIEAEQSKNYKKGIKQVKDVEFSKFIDREILPHLPSGVKSEKYLCTYGKYNNEPEVIFNLTEDFQINYNVNAEVIK